MFDDLLLKLQGLALAEVGKWQLLTELLGCADISWVCYVLEESAMQRINRISRHTCCTTEALQVVITTFLRCSVCESPRHTPAYLTLDARS